MAEFKPYDENKSWIEFKLNPDYIIDELGNLIPYRHTIGMMDSEAPWSEVGKMALRETPVLGSLLYGEPVDAAKEAILLMSPGGKNSKKLKLKEKEINKKLNDRVDSEIKSQTKDYDYYEFTVTDNLPTTDPRHRLPHSYVHKAPKGANPRSYVAVAPFETLTYKPASKQQIKKHVLDYEFHEGFEELLGHKSFDYETYRNNYGDYTGVYDDLYEAVGPKDAEYFYTMKVKPYTDYYTGERLPYSAKNKNKATMKDVVQDAALNDLRDYADKINESMYGTTDYVYNPYIFDFNLSPNPQLQNATNKYRRKFIKNLREDPETMTKKLNDYIDDSNGYIDKLLRHEFKLRRMNEDF